MCQYGLNNLSIHIHTYIHTSEHFFKVPGKVKEKEVSGVDLFSDDILASFTNRKETINAEIFLISRPSLFFAGMKYIFLTMAIYLALWLLQYVPASISVRNMYVCMYVLCMYDTKS